MAHLSVTEFEDCISLLVGDGSPAKLRDRLANLGAIHSRRGLNSTRAIAERLYAMSSGLRRDVPPARAFQGLWAEMVAGGLTEKSGGALDDLADKINDTLDAEGKLKDGRSDDLDQRLAEYEELLARKIGGRAARLDMLQKAVAVVAERLRAKPVLDVPRDPPEEPEEEHVHGPGCDHDHASAAAGATAADAPGEDDAGEARD